MEKATLVGIDPGRTGAIAYVKKEDNSYELVLLYNIPVPRKTKDYDIKKLSELMDSVYVVSRGRRIHGRPIIYTMEDVYLHKSGGRKAAFGFGRGRGILEGLLGAKGITPRLIRPKDWKKIFGIKEKEEALSIVYQYVKGIDDIISKSKALHKLRIDQAESILIAIAEDVVNQRNKEKLDEN